MGASIDPKALIPKLLQIDFWNDYLDSIAGELDLVKNEGDLLPLLFDTRNQTDEDEFIRMMETFGYIPNREVDSSLQYLKNEANTLTQKIKNKSTYSGYYYFIKALQYKGDVYNLYHDELTFVKGIDATDIITTLNTYGFDPSAPFTQFTPDYYYSIFNTSEDTLDASPTEYLDATPTTYLDSASKSKATKHLQVELFPEAYYTVDSTDYLLTKEYFSYLQYSCNYNKKATEIAHAGIQVNSFMDETGTYNTLSGSTYSTDALKLNCSTTPMYINNEIEQIYLDTGYYTDSSIKWYLDQREVQAKTLNEKFYWIVGGTGTRPLYSSSYPNLFSNLIGHWAFDNKYASIAYDYSINRNNGTVIGSYTRVTNGIINGSIEYNGIDVGVSVSDFVADPLDKTLIFWVNGLDAEQLEATPCLFHSNFLDVIYTVATTTLDVTITGDTSSVAMSVVSDILDGDDHQIMVEIDVTNGDVYLYVDNVQVDTNVLTGVGSIAGNYSLKFGYRGVSDWYKGLLDDFKIYNRILSAGEKTYLYTNMVGALGSLSNEIYRDRISLNQINDTDATWRFIYSKIEGNAIKRMSLAMSDGSITNYSGTLDIINIIPKTFKVDYTYGEDFTIADDGSGVLDSTNFEGTIDYETGVYDLTFYKDYSITGEVLASGSVSSLSTSLAQTGVQEETFRMYYRIGSISYTAVSNGAGVITGTGISSGSVNSAGGLSVTFSTPTDASTITCKYDYRVEGIPDTGTEIFVSYKTSDNIEITEAGILDNSGNLVVYSTFPKIQFHDTTNHAGMDFFIKKV